MRLEKALGEINLTTLYLIRLLILVRIDFFSIVTPGVFLNNIDILCRLSTDLLDHFRRLIRFFFSRNLLRDCRFFSDL